MKEIIVKTKGDYDSSKVDIDSAHIWSHNGILKKNSLVKRINGGEDCIGGNGTEKDPFIKEFTEFKKFMYIAKFKGYKESLAYGYPERSTYTIEEDKNDKDYWSNTISYFYNYKNWKKGNSTFDTWWRWEEIMRNLEVLRDLGYSFNKLPSTVNMLSNLDEENLKSSILDFYKEAWTHVSPKLEIKIKKGDKAKLSMYVLGKIRTLHGVIVEEKAKRLFFVSNDKFSKTYHVEKQSDLVGGTEAAYHLIASENEECDVWTGPIKIPVYDYSPSGNYVFGAIKYNNFEII